MASQAHWNAGVFLSGKYPESSSEKWMLSASRVILHWTSCRCFLSQWTGSITRMECMLAGSLWSCWKKKIWVVDWFRRSRRWQHRATRRSARFDIPSTSLRQPLGFRIRIAVQGRESGHFNPRVGPLSFDGGECRDFYPTILWTFMTWGHSPYWLKTRVQMSQTWVLDKQGHLWHDIQGVIFVF